MRVFIGHDSRVPMQYHVCTHSLLEHTSTPLEIIPLKLDTLPLKRRGLTEFSFARFLTPWLCGFEGKALFLDSDILCTGDIAALDRVNVSGVAVAAVKTDPAFERAAVMLFNCAHPDNQVLTPEAIEKIDAELDKPHLLGWTQQIGWLPNRFNFLVSYDKPEWMQGKTPTLVHYTRGVPAWPETQNCDYADLWLEARERAFRPAVDWNTLMGKSVHAVPGPSGVGLQSKAVPDVTRRHL